MKDIDWRMAAWWAVFLGFSVGVWYGAYRLALLIGDWLS